MKVLDRLRDVALRRHLAAATIDCYRHWVADFLRFAKSVAGRWRAPADLGGADLERYLTHLARDRRVGASTQDQAMNAIVFLYRRVLADELPPDHLGPIAAERSHRAQPPSAATERSRRPVRLPTACSVRRRSSAFWRRWRPRRARTSPRPLPRRP
jgi:site-specific recombinase XerD